MNFSIARTGADCARNSPDDGTKPGENALTTTPAASARRASSRANKTLHNLLSLYALFPSNAPPSHMEKSPASMPARSPSVGVAPLRPSGLAGSCTHEDVTATREPRRMHGSRSRTSAKCPRWFTPMVSSNPSCVRARGHARSRGCPRGRGPRPRCTPPRRARRRAGGSARRRRGRPRVSRGQPRRARRFPRAPRRAPPPPPRPRAPSPRSERRRERDTPRRTSAWPPRARCRRTPPVMSTVLPVPSKVASTPGANANRARRHVREPRDARRAGALGGARAARARARRTSSQRNMMRMPSSHAVPCRRGGRRAIAIAAGYLEKARMDSRKGGFWLRRRIRARPVRLSARQNDVSTWHNQSFTRRPRRDIFFLP